MEYSKYIFPIKGALDGTGTLVGNLFITAGHVVVGSKSPSVNIGDDSYNLTAENKIYLDDNKSRSSEGYDLAVYKLDGIESPILLSEDIPDKSIELLNISYKHTSVENPEYTGSVFDLPRIEKWIPETNHGHVIEYYDNYFECMMDEELCRGRSGSPILDGNKVVGILYGDKDGKDSSKDSSKTVLFLSSKAILTILKEKGVL